MPWQLGWRQTVRLADIVNLTARTIFIRTIHRIIRYPSSMSRSARMDMLRLRRRTGLSRGLESMRFIWYEWRLNGFDRMGQAGVHKIGMGVLIGLEDWRTDVTMMARHLRYLEKTYWRTQYSVNFPRMRHAENGGFQPNVIMSDRELAQATFAMRIFDHDVDISYSTREPANVRNNMATLGVTTMSAESHTDPGGYACYPNSLEQFEISDNRKAGEVERDLRALGLEPVWKNWDRVFDVK